jgi:hypothetical protein
MIDQVAVSFCDCGCGKNVKKSTSHFLPGHYVRFLNKEKNPSFDLVVRKKLSEHARDRHRNGLFPLPWNKDKTFEQDSRIAHGHKGSLSSSWKIVPHLETSHSSTRWLEVHNMSENDTRWSETCRSSRQRTIRRYPKEQYHRILRRKDP